MKKHEVIEQILINYRSTEGADEKDLILAIMQYNKEVTLGKCECTKNNTIKEFDSIDGVFCTNCGNIYPF